MTALIFRNSYSFKSARPTHNAIITSMPSGDDCKWRQVLRSRVTPEWSLSSGPQVDLGKTTWGYSLLLDTPVRLGGQVWQGSIELAVAKDLKGLYFSLKGGNLLIGHKHLLCLHS